jgi:hypothetical protein
VENDLLAGEFCQPSTFGSESLVEKNSLLNERTGNVDEKKGPSQEVEESRSRGVEIRRIAQPSASCQERLSTAELLDH